MPIGEEYIHPLSHMMFCVRCGILPAKRLVFSYDQTTEIYVVDHMEQSENENGKMTTMTRREEKKYNSLDVVNSSILCFRLLPAWRQFTKLNLLLQTWYVITPTATVYVLQRSV